ncbi:MAG TPA: YifB family Mg chelatase-like AAA ATPase [Candidatus Omnitrophota bacterium]|nr:YifB family Mg chelatase-like AAA ATPase [Candidatus Omnitrophota bacterium]
MLSKTYSYALNGIDSYLVTIEVDCSRGLPATIIVGLPDNTLKESKERVRAAIKNSGHKFPISRSTINLSPADTKKEGPSFDLPIALGILASSEQISPQRLNEYAILGELSLDGKVKPVKGALSIALSMDKNRFKGLLLPSANAPEAAIADVMDVYPVDSLNQVIHFLSDPESIRPFKTDPSLLTSQPDDEELDFADVKGLSHVKRGLEVCAAGAHNCLLMGSPGTGKSLVLRRLNSIVPKMSREEILETTRIYSAMGLVKSKTGMVTQRPFRAPHHTTSDVALVGGGSNPRPGEVTLAHNGILFLDELPEFNRNALEALRQPLEDKHVTIARASKTMQFPANFMFVAAMNPCPCGFFTDPKRECRCSSWQIQRYISKVSGPLLDRIDIHLDVPPLPPAELLSNTRGETSAQIKERTIKAREIQKKRFAGTSITVNAQLNHRQLKEYCPLSPECRGLLKQAIEELNFSARAHDKIIKIARTVSDLAGSKRILPEHIAEAIQYRSLDRSWWG